jgi:hypothetical protein
MIELKLTGLPILAVLLLISGCATAPHQSIAHWSPPRYYAAHVDSVLVLVQDKSGRHSSDDGLYDKIERRFAERLMDKGYSVVSRDKFDAIAKEMSFQTSGLTSDDGAAKLGRMVNASAVLVVTINNSQSETHRESGVVTQNEVIGHDRKGKPIYGTVQQNESWEASSAEGSVSAKMIPIETAIEIWTASYAVMAQGTTDTRSVIERSAIAVAAAIPDQQEQKATGAESGSATSAAGANPAPTPKDAQPSGGF